MNVSAGVLDARTPPAPDTFYSPMCGNARCFQAARRPKHVQLGIVAKQLARLGIVRTRRLKLVVEGAWGGERAA